MTIFHLLETIKNQGGLLKQGLKNETEILERFPEDYGSLLKCCNGFILGDESLQIFGIPEVLSWNKSAWKAYYGDLVKGLFFVGQDAFGDQYAYGFKADGKTTFIKFDCEGGSSRKMQEIKKISDFIRYWIDKHEATEFDWRLFAEAKSEGKPILTGGKHLAFSLPLVSGGEYSKNNLSIESWELHLAILGQMSIKNRKLTNNQRIDKFIEGA